MRPWITEEMRARTRSNIVVLVVGAALLALNVIAGDEGQYGLYVKTVNGITADYDKDQTWWAFYVDGVSASAGVDSTDIVNGSTYGFKVEK